MGKNSEKAKKKIGFHDGLPQIRANAAGIDVGASELWVDVGGKDPEPVRRFETFTADLHEIGDWLKRCGIETAAMESTGVYWIPICQILESKGIEVVLVNARHAKNVSGRKTDMVDCQWLRILHRYGLLAASFRPARYIGVLRAYMWNEETIAKALEGDYRPEHLFALKQSLELFDSYQKQIEACHQQIADHLKSLESKANPAEALKASRTTKKKRRNQPQFNLREEAFRISGVDLTQIDSINESAALGLLAEIGVDMRPWKTEKHFASWLTLCPNNKISGGRVLHRATRKSASRARDIFRLCAQTLLGSRSALGAYCRRMCGRLGSAKGIVAVAHKLALLVYRMIRFGRDYIDIGQERYEEKYKERVLKNLARRAKDFGFQLVPSIPK